MTKVKTLAPFSRFCSDLVNFKSTNIARISVVFSAIVLCHHSSRSIRAIIINVTARSVRVKYTKREQPEAQ